MITPMDIHNKTFSRKLRGYAEDEVNSFLEEVVSDYERIYREHREMEEQMDTLKTKLANYEKMESTMSTTLVLAQETAENVRQNSQKEADLILREAKAQAAQIVADADARRRSTNEAVMRTESDMKLYVEKILTNLTSAMTMIEAVKAQQAPKVEAVPAQEAPAAAPEEAPATAEDSPAEDLAAAPEEDTVSGEDETEEEAGK